MQTGDGVETDVSRLLKSIDPVDRLALTAPGINLLD